MCAACLDWRNEMTDLTVNLADRSYDISIGSGAFELLAPELAKRKSKCVCVADKSVLKYHAAKAQKLAVAAEIIPVAGGEASKSFGMLEKLCSAFAQMKLDRKSAVVALGGGVVGDLAGFAASAYMRGVDFYQVPTTLLAMVDSSVGGKTGINIAEGKNLVGAFHQPRGVFADTDFLASLPEREFAAGMAEVVKCGILGDAQLFDALADESTDIGAYLNEAIRRSCSLKAAVVASDERETASSGGRALLNLGHTFGHAVEKTAGYGRYLHGEAVAIGTVMACELSKRLGLSDERGKVEKVLTRLGLPVSVNYKVSAADFMEAIAHDKKNAGGELKFVLVEKIGSAITRIVPRAEVEKVVADFLG